MNQNKNFHFNIFFIHTIFVILALVLALVLVLGERNTTSSQPCETKRGFWTLEKMQDKTVPVWTVVPLLKMIGENG